jgi:hypothetical protein
LSVASRTGASMSDLQPLLARYAAEEGTRGREDEPAALAVDTGVPGR